MGTACGLELPGQRQRPNAEPSVPPPVQPWGVATRLAVGCRRRSSRGLSAPSSRGVSASSSRRGPTVSSPLHAGTGSMGFVRCVPAGAGYPLTVPAPSGPEPLPHSPRSGRQPIARGGSPWIPAPRCVMSPRRGATGRYPRTGTGRPFGAWRLFPGFGIPRLPPGAIGGRLLQEPDDTRPGLNTAGRRPWSHTSPTSIPHNRCS